MLTVLANGNTVVWKKNLEFAVFAYFGPYCGVHIYLAPASSFIANQYRKE
jgi:hypothetical protein